MGLRRWPRELCEIVEVDGECRQREEIEGVLLDDAILLVQFDEHALDDDASTESE